jgi:hypothetical protein
MGGEVEPDHDGAAELLNKARHFFWRNAAEGTAGVCVRRVEPAATIRGREFVNLIQIVPPTRTITRKSA